MYMRISKYYIKNPGVKIVQNVLDGNGFLIWKFRKVHVHVDNKIRINRIVTVHKSFLEPLRQIETNIAKKNVRTYKRNSRSLKWKAISLPFLGVLLHVVYNWKWKSHVTLHSPVWNQVKILTLCTFVWVFFSFLFSFFFPFSNSSVVKIFL